jgi:2-keto-4-pentenoate hydratase
MSSAPRPFDAVRAARFIADAHASGAAYRNLPDDLAPATVAEAYAAQEALRALWEPRLGTVAGLKIATTTRVMQELMGIDHPCGGMIYETRVHRSPATIAKSAYRNLVIECELAVRLARELPRVSAPHTRETALAAVGEVMAAYELIDDRGAVYKECKALSLIADNAWNAGVVLGAATPPPPGSRLDAIGARVTINGREVKAGKTDDPLGALAWVANLAAERHRPMTAGMIVITGSVVPTFPVAPGDQVRFEIDGIGAAEMRVTG